MPERHDLEVAARVLVATLFGGLGAASGTVEGAAAASYAGAVFAEWINQLSEGRRKEAERLHGDLSPFLDGEAERLYNLFSPGLAGLADLDFDPERAADETLRHARGAGERVSEGVRAALTDGFGVLAAQREQLPQLQSEFRRVVMGRLNEVSDELRRLAAPRVLLHLPVERREPTTPSHLLRADFAVVPYEERPCFEAELREWLEEGDFPKVRLIHAAGGGGKTRLMLHWCHRLTPEWSAGFLDRAHTEGAGPEVWRALAEGAGPLLVVVDYADGRREEVKWLLLHLQRHAPNRRVRVVLLARQRGEWWERELPASEPEVERLMEGASERELPGLGEEVERARLFADAARAFARHGGLLRRDPDQPLPESPDLSAPLFASVLMVHAAAYLALAGEEIGDKPETLFKAVMVHEERHWRRRLEGVGDAAIDALGELVALATLAAGFTRLEIEPAAAWSPATDRHLNPETRHRVLAAWRALYPAEGGGIAPLLPDRLGEWWVARRLADNPCLPEPLLGSERPTDSVFQVLTVLDRIARWEPKGVDWLERALALAPSRLAPLALPLAVTQGSRLPRILLGMLRRNAGRESADTLLLILDSEYQATLALGEVALEVTRLRVDVMTDLKGDEAQAERARLLNNLSNRLSALGRHEKALGHAEEAVDSYRSLAAQRPDAFLPDLAMSLNNLATHLSALGRHEKAHGHAQEAVDGYRTLIAQRPDAFLPDLAASLNNLATYLSALGRREEALDCVQEAVDSYRTLEAQRPDAFLPDFAMSLNNLAAILSDLGCREEALGHAQEAVDRYRALVARRPDAFLPDLAMSLKNLATFLSALGRREEALGHAQEAADRYRTLVAQRPDAFLPDLTGSLNNLSNRLSALGRHEEALSCAEEAVDISRPLAAQRPDAFLPDLAMFLSNLSNHLSALGRHEEALGRAKEAVDIRRTLAGQRSEAFLPDLCRSLGVMGSIHLQQPEGAGEAKACFAEGVALLTPYFQRIPPAFGELMGKLVRAYLDACKAMGEEPDVELLAPATEVFLTMREGEAS